jgi:regulator of replication initiation timing
MFNQIKCRLAALEQDTVQLRAELAELKRTLWQVLGENEGLRRENDRVIRLSGIAPAYPRVSRHKWPMQTPQKETAADHPDNRSA